MGRDARFADRSSSGTCWRGPIAQHLEPAGVLGAVPFAAVCGGVDDPNSAPCSLANRRASSSTSNTGGVCRATSTVAACDPASTAEAARRIRGPTYLTHRLIEGERRAMLRVSVGQQQRRPIHRLHQISGIQNENNDVGVERAAGFEVARFVGRRPAPAEAFSTSTRRCNCSGRSRRQQRRENLRLIDVRRPVCDGVAQEENAERVR